MPPAVLGEFELLVLLALVRLGDDAYGMAVRRELVDRTDRDVSVGAVYATLDRLEEKGLTRSRVHDGPAARGGRARRFYDITAAGRRAVRESQRVLARMLDGLDLGIAG